MHHREMLLCGGNLLSATIFITFLYGQRTRKRWYLIMSGHCRQFWNSIAHTYVCNNVKTFVVAFQERLLYDFFTTEDLFPRRKLMLRIKFTFVEFCGISNWFGVNLVIEKVMYLTHPHTWLKCTYLTHARISCKFPSKLILFGNYTNK